MPGNDSGHRAGGRADIPNIVDPTVPLSTNVVALERIEDGDTAGAVDVLLAADEARPAPCDRRCPRCTFSGPAGLLEFHLLHSHGIDDWDLVEELVRRAA